MKKKLLSLSTAKFISLSQSQETGYQIKLRKNYLKNTAIFVRISYLLLSLHSPQYLRSSMYVLLMRVFGTDTHPQTHTHRNTHAGM